MRIRLLLYGLMLLPITMTGQSVVPDTIPLSQALLKATGNYTIQNSVDTAITIVINELMARNSGGITDDAGDDDDWFEIYNYGDLPVRLNNLWFSDNPQEPLKWRLISDQDIVLEPGEYLLFWADEEPQEGITHTNFRLSGDGEYLCIYSADNLLIDECYYGPQLVNISYGRYPDGEMNWLYFDIPSPGKENSHQGGSTLLPMPVSNLLGGIFSDPILLTLSTTVEECEIRYTVDCKDPTKESLLYSDPILIDKTTILKARILKDSALDGPILTRSFIFEADSFANPVLSIVADPDDLFGQTGIITLGTDNIEISAHMEYIVNRATTYSSGTGIQLHSVKNYKPYSMRLYARSRYGNSWFDYPFFEDRAPDKHKRLILRNSGNDNITRSVFNTQFRDPLIQTIAKTSSRDYMISESVPVSVLLNGDFYGLHNLRERIDGYYLETHASVESEFDLLERAFGYPGNRNAIEGTFQDWDSLLAFVNVTGDLALDEDFHKAAEQVNIDNFTDYWITEVFAGNYDWLSNNIKFWKPEGGKWQWIYWDTDHGLGLDYGDYGEVVWNTLAWSLGFSDRAGTTGNNNRLIRNLLKNENYKEQFITRFTNLLNTSFSPAQTVPLLDSMIALYKYDIRYHLLDELPVDRSMIDWENACDIVRDYLINRPDEVFSHIRDYFNLEEPESITFMVEPPGAGIIKFGNLEASTDTLSARLFPGIEYTFKAEPRAGFVFSNWSYSGITDNSITFEISDSSAISDTVIIAHFMMPDSIVPFQIDELYFNNRNSYDCGDWIEFYYFGIDPIDISGYQIMVENEKQFLFTFNNGSIINPREYFVVTEDLDRFKKVYPESIRCFGNFMNTLPNQGVLKLKSNSGKILKEMAYMSEPDLWPILPAEAFSIELNEISDDPNNGSNWQLSENSFGSPGISNYLSYNYHNPLGKDVLYNSTRTKTIPFQSSNDFFFDQDGHQLAAISVQSVTGPGIIQSGNTLIESETIYAASDFVYYPNSSSNDEITMLYYKFVDYSGEESPVHTIAFMNLSNSVESTIRHDLEIYPIPASDECYIKFPVRVDGNLLFRLYDINGHIAKEMNVDPSAETIRIELSNIRNGLYFYLFQDNKTAYSGRILIQE